MGTRGVLVMGPLTKKKKINASIIAISSTYNFDMLLSWT